MLQEQANNYAELLHARKFDFRNNIAPDRIYFTVENGVDDPAVIGTAGNFVAITGLPKARKSTIVSALVASYITGKPIYTFSLKIFKDKDRIAVFDTEQSPFDFNRQIHTIERLTGYSKPEIFNFVDAFMMREDDPDVILKLINAYLNENKNVGIFMCPGSSI